MFGESRPRGVRPIVALVCCAAFAIAAPAVAAPTATDAAKGKAKAKPPKKPKPVPGGKKKPGGRKKPGAKPKPGAKRRKPPRRPPAEFFAIQGWGALTAGELQAARAGGLGTQRIFFGWTYIEPSPGAREWAYPDHQIAAAAANGLTPLPVLFSTPTYLSGTKPVSPPPPSPAGGAALAAFAGDAVRRYGPGGEFWRLNPGLPYRPVTRWQLWNEPSSVWYSDGSPDGSEYAVLVRDAGAAIKAADPNAIVLLAGLLPNKGDPNGVPVRTFLRQLYAVRGIRKHFDEVAIHPYTTRPSRVIEIAEQVRRLLSRKDPRVGLWITELGWSTGGSGNPRLTVDPASQAQKLTRTYEALLERRRALGLQGIVWHVLRDYPSTGGQRWEHYTGLFDAGRNAKPAWEALTRITGGQAAGIPESPSPPPPPENDPCFLLVFC